MTPDQKKRFQKICKDMQALIDEMHSSNHPDAVLFIEDGGVSIYDWHTDQDRRPDEPLVSYSGYWHKAGGGGH